MKSVGYHYTTYENWEKIKINGLIPYWIENEEVYENISRSTGIYPKRFKAVWLWTHKLKGNSHIGTVLYQAMTKVQTKVVLLKIQYDSKNLYYQNDGEKRLKVVTTHYGCIGKFIYHKKEPAVFYTHPVLPKNIELVKAYNLKTLLA